MSNNGDYRKNQQGSYTQSTSHQKCSNTNSETVHPAMAFRLSNTIDGALKGDNTILKSSSNTHYCLQFPPALIRQWFCRSTRCRPRHFTSLNKLPPVLRNRRLIARKKRGKSLAGEGPSIGTQYSANKLRSLIYRRRARHQFINTPRLLALCWNSSLIYCGVVCPSHATVPPGRSVTPSNDAPWALNADCRLVLGNSKRG